MRRTAIWPATPRWCWPSRASMKPRDIADKLAAKLTGRCRHRKRRGGGSRLPQPDASCRPFWHGVVRHPRRGRRLRPRRPSATARRSTSSTCPPTRPGRCTSAMAAAPCSAMRSPTCWRSPATTVTREYYINDAGAQVDALARSAFLRYREALGEDIGEIPAGPLSRRLPEAGRRGAGRRARPRRCSTCPRSAGCRSCASSPSTAMMAVIKEDLGAAQHPPRRVLLGALADDRRRRTRCEPRSRSCAPRGSSTRAGCRSPRATTTSEWEDREQTLFKSTAVRRRRRPRAA